MAIRLSVNSVYNPFTFDELIKPYLIYGLAYKELEDALTALSVEAGQWEKKINETSDPIAAAQYKKYADDLRALVNKLVTEGLSPSSRRGLVSMKARYATEIDPIKTAYERRRLLADEQRKLFGSNSSLRFSNDWSKALITQDGKQVGTIDALLSNPELSYESLSGNDIATRAANMAKNLASAVVNDPKYSKILGGQYFQLKLQMGYTPELIIFEATGDSNAPKELKNIRESITQQIEGNSAYDKAWADAYINQGMYQAIGTAKYDLVKNGEYIDAAQRKSLAMQAERNDLALKEFNAKYEPDGKGGYKLRTTLIPMEDGNSYDPSTGTIRNKKGEIIANAKGGAVSKTTSSGVQKNGSLPFTLLDYTGGGFNEPGSTDKFSVSDSLIYDKSKLLPKQRKNLEKYLLAYGLTLDDVDVYEDVDWFSANHYRVVPKGYTAEGKPKDKEELDFE